MSNNYKDASERLAEEMRQLSFNDMVKYVNSLQEQNSELVDRLDDASERIDQLDTEPLVVSLRNSINILEETLDEWVEIANDLFEGLLQAEQQLAKANIGLRPLAAKAKKAFIEMTDEDEG